MWGDEVYSPELYCFALVDAHTMYCFALVDAHTMLRRRRCSKDKVCAAERSLGGYILLIYCNMSIISEASLITFQYYTFLKSHFVSESFTAIMYD